jgi:hypothetical protein
LLLPSLEKAKSLISQIKSCHITTPQNYFSDKLDPEEFQTYREVNKQKELKQTLATALYPSRNSQESK